MTIPRSAGETELRLNSANADCDPDFLNGHVTKLLNPGMIDQNQVIQSMFPRGFASDINAEDFLTMVDEPFEPDPLLLEPESVDTGSEIDKLLQKMFAEINDPPSPIDPIDVSATPLNDSEYFNRKLELTRQSDPTQTLIQFVFDTGVYTKVPLNKVTREVRLPYKDCKFVFKDAETEVIAKELSPKQFFFWMTFYSQPVMVQVNQFANKDKGKIFYKTFMAEGPGKVLDANNPVQQYKPQAEALIDQIFGFLDACARGAYSVEHNDRDFYPTNQIPPEAKEGDVYKIITMSVKQAIKERKYLGGTHASPREHERVGHYRTLRNGERRWFNATTVNKGKTKGKIIKDYRITEPDKK